MALDFSYPVYRKLILALRRSNYAFYTFDQYSFADSLPERCVILRHDVDRFATRALSLARIESEMDISSTYFFRVKPISFNESVISEILKLGHEIGYHYEELTEARGNFELAWRLFLENVGKFNKFGGVRTIVMHGRPFSKWDNRDLWKRYDYRELGIRIDAFLSIPWGRFLYFTDTGRRWDNRANIKDILRISNGSFQLKAPVSTDDLIGFLKKYRKSVVISIHPERWNNGLGWLQSYLLDKCVNLVKVVWVGFRGPACRLV